MNCQYPITKNSEEKECDNRAKYHGYWGWAWCDKHARNKEGKLKPGMQKLGSYEQED